MKPALVSGLGGKRMGMAVAAVLAWGWIGQAAGQPAPPSGATASVQAASAPAGLGAAAVPAATAAAVPAPSAEAGPAGGSILRSLTRWIDPNASVTAEATTQEIPAQDAEQMEEALKRAREMGGEDAVLKSFGMANPPEIFQREEEVEKVLGKDPRWVWRADAQQGRSDPMLIPWIADKVIFVTQDARARALEDSGQLEEAMKICQEMLDHIHEPSYASRVQDRINELKGKIEARDEALRKAQLAAEQAAQGSQPAIPEPVLPQYIVSETRGILYDPSPGGVSVVSVGEDNLRVGQAVPNYPEVVVKSIGYQSVVFTVSNEYKSKDFEIKVEGNAIETPAQLETKGAP